MQMSAAMTNALIQTLAAMLLAASATGCSLMFGAACLSQQQRAHVTTITGDAAPDTVIVHEVAYGTAGSQNDITIKWVGQRNVGGPRLRVYATKGECDTFDPRVAVPRASACASIGSRGSTVAPDARPCVRDDSCKPVADELVQSSLGITHGRGNPEQLGPTVRYKLWIFTDSRQATSYTIDVTSFYGPDC